MEKKKIIYLSLASFLALAVLFLIAGLPFSRNIPSPPGKDEIPDFLNKQIRSASRKAKLWPSAHNIGTLGMVYHSGALYDKASVCYSVASGRDSTEWIWDYYLGYMNREMGESEKAAMNFRRVVSIYPEAYHAWFYLGDIYLGQGQYEEADKALSRINSIYQVKIPANELFRTDHFPIGTYSSYLLAQSRISAGLTDSAEKTLLDLLDHSPNFGPAYRLLGNISQTRGDEQAAGKYIQRANDNLFSTAPADTLLDMISIMSRSDQYILKQIDEADYYFYYDWALTLADHALQYMPDNKFLLSKTIKILLKTDRGTAALAYLDKHLRSFADDFEEVKQVADMLYEKNYFSQSRNYYSRAMELHPENPAIQANLVLGLINEGNEQQALSFLNGCLELYGTDKQVVTNAVYVMLVLKDQEKADLYLNKLRELSPSDTKLFLLSGYMAQQKGNLEMAREYYERSFNSDPGELLAAQALGEILIRQKNWRGALNSFKKAMEYFPNEPFIIEKLGSLLVMCPDSTLRNYREGIEYLERLMVHRSCAPDIKISAGRSLANAYRDLSENDRASFYANYTLNLVQVYSFSSPVIINEMQEMLKQLK